MTELTRLSVRRDGPVAYVTLNRPAVRNAFDERLIAELTAWANAAPLDPTLRVLVLDGAGPVFSAGADLDWMARMAGASRADNLRDATAAAQLFSTLDRLPLPLVARIHGAALGGGCGLAAVCDIVVASDDAVFGFTEVKLGIIPATIAPYVLAKIGRSAARELFLTGERFPAERARALGLVHTVVPAAELDAAVAHYVQALLGAAPGAIAAAKLLITQAWTGGDTPGIVAVTAEAIADRRASDEGRAGLAAFLGHRQAPWVPR